VVTTGVEVEGDVSIGRVEEERRCKWNTLWEPPLLATAAATTGRAATAAGGGLEGGEFGGVGGASRVAWGAREGSTCSGSLMRIRKSNTHIQQYSFF